MARVLERPEVAPAEAAVPADAEVGLSGPAPCGGLRRPVAGAAAEHRSMAARSAGRPVHLEPARHLKTGEHSHQVNQRRQLTCWFAAAVVASAAPAAAAAAVTAGGGSAKAFVFVLLFHDSACHLAK